MLPIYELLQPNFLPLQNQATSNRFCATQPDLSFFILKPELYIIVRSWLVFFQTNGTFIGLASKKVSVMVEGM